MSEGAIQYGMPILTASWPRENLCLLGGGGGATKSGIKNRIILVEVKDGNLSETAHELDFGEEFPFKCALHQNCSDLVVSFGLKAAKHLVLEKSKSKEQLMEAQESGAKDVFDGIESVISAVTFSRDGKLLCLGYEEGGVHVWEWPEMKKKIDFRVTEESDQLSDLDMDPNCRALAISSDDGSCKLWSLTDGKLLETLKKPGIGRPKFAHCKFSLVGQQALFTTLNTGKQGAYVLKWGIGANWSVKLAKKKRVAADAVSSFALSSHGDMLAVGTGGGDIMVLTTGRMHPLYSFKEAHMVFVTALAFQQEDVNSPSPKVVGLLSASADHSARVSFVKRRSEFSAWLSAMGPLILLMMILLLVAVIQLVRQRALPSSATDEL